MITDFQFISGLAKPIGTKPNRPFELVTEKDKTWTPRYSVQDIHHQNIHSY